MNDILQKSINAMRSAGDEPSADSSQTRLRVRRSLERRARGRRRLIQSSLIVGGLLISGLSWAVSTGRISFRRAEPTVETTTPDPVERTPLIPMHLPEPPRAAKVTVPAVVTINETLHAPSTIEIAPEPVAPIVKPAPKAEPIETLYRAAHELHFHGADHAATLAAWDAYLAADPQGRFAIEARYNRAIILVRVKRYTEALAALQPYARGEVANGYRAAEAKQLVDRLSALNGTAGTGN